MVSATFRVVCLGGSAGGLRAYLDILGHLPADSDMAFVVAPHRGFEYAHLLPQLLRRVTAMPVLEVTQGMRLEVNGVYIMPPGQDMTLKAGQFELRATIKAQGWPVTLNRLLVSLAEVYGPRAVAVILSGLDHDGSAALQAIKAAGGVTFAQSQADFSDMPRHAVETGHIDFILLPAQIAEGLLALAR